MSEGLKPCLCGQEQSDRQMLVLEQCDSDGYFIKCDSCGACGPVGYPGDDYDAYNDAACDRAREEAKSKAISMWNELWEGRERLRAELAREKEKSRSCCCIWCGDAIVTYQGFATALPGNEKQYILDACRKHDDECFENPIRAERDDAIARVKKAESERLIATNKEEQWKERSEMAERAVGVGCVWFGTLDDNGYCPVCAGKIREDGQGHIMDCPYPHFVAWDRCQAEAAQRSESCNDEEKCGSCEWAQSKHCKDCFFNEHWEAAKHEKGKECTN